MQNVWLGETLMKSHSQILRVPFEQTLEANIPWISSCCGPLISHLTKQVRWTRYAEEVKTNILSTFSYRLLHIKAPADQEGTIIYNICKGHWIQSRRTCQKRLIIGTDSERKTKEHMQRSPLDDDDIICFWFCFVRLFFKVHVAFFNSNFFPSCCWWKKYFLSIGIIECWPMVQGDQFRVIPKTQKNGTWCLL